jgi:3-methyladenine DNA glycosylase AlkD
LSSLSSSIRKKLRAAADPEAKASYEWYFKGQVPFLGVRTPNVRRIFRDTVPPVSAYPVARAVDDAFALLRSRSAEEKQVGVLLLHRYRRELPPDFLRRLEPVFDVAVREWGTCDGISARVLRHLLQHSSAGCRQVVSWSRSRNPWRQRASAVAFVNEARHGAHTAEIIQVCERIVENPGRFVQLGMGWVLRELWLAEPKAVLAFLRQHYPTISREGLRYAIEKMPAAQQRRLLVEHAAAREAARGRADMPNARQTGATRRSTRP